MNFVDAIRKGLTDAIKFDGRSRRSEFWYFVLFNLVVTNVVDLIDGRWDLLSSLVSLALAVPTIAAGIRRMHDIGRVGWWILVPFYSIYLATIDSQPGANQYGENPKGM